MVAFFSKSDESKTIWVSARGSQTTVDYFTDLMWLIDSKVIGGLLFPAEPLIRAQKSLILLFEFIKKTDAKQIYFCGHSLGIRSS